MRSEKPGEDEPERKADHRRDTIWGATDAAMWKNGNSRAAIRSNSHVLATNNTPG